MVTQDQAIVRDQLAKCATALFDRITTGECPKTDQIIEFGPAAQTLCAAILSLHQPEYAQAMHRWTPQALMVLPFVQQLVTLRINQIHQLLMGFGPCFSAPTAFAYGDTCTHVRAKCDLALFQAKHALCSNTQPLSKSINKVHPLSLSLTTHIHPSHLSVN